jgi:hypothetical protein
VSCHTRKRKGWLPIPFVLHRKCTPSFQTRLFISKLHKVVLVHSGSDIIKSSEIKKSLALEMCAHLALHALPPKLQANVIPLFVHKLAWPNKEVPSLAGLDRSPTPAGMQCAPPSLSTEPMLDRHIFLVSAWRRCRKILLLEPWPSHRPISRHHAPTHVTSPYPRISSVQDLFFFFDERPRPG